MAEDRRAPRGYLRDREDEDSARVSFVELFFDLVFVFAVTQLAAYLAENLSAEGLVRAAVLFMALWWLWITTTWATNRLDPDRGLVRGVIFALMGAGLIFSVSLTEAFEGRGAVFAGAYVLIQVGRSLFMVWALGQAGEDVQRATLQRNTVWFAISGLLWIAGALAESDLRIVLWAVAILIDLAVPWIGFWVPGLGRSSAGAWDIEGEHLTERCGLFIILALGESVLVSGTRMETLDWDAGTLASFAVAILGSLVMWWIYFDRGPGAAPGPSRNPRSRAAWPASPTPTCTCPSWRAWSWWPSATSSSWPIPKALRASRRGWCSLAGPGCSSWGTSSSRTRPAGAGRFPMPSASPCWPCLKRFAFNLTHSLPFGSSSRTLWA